LEDIEAFARLLTALGRGSVSWLLLADGPIGSIGFIPWPTHLGMSRRARAMPTLLSRMRPLLAIFVLR